MKTVVSRFAVAVAVATIGVSAAAAQQAAAPEETAKPKAAKVPAKHKAGATVGHKEAAAEAGASPTLLGQYGDWGAYWAPSGANKVCFVLAKPTATQTTPANRPRNPIYFFVASRPAENVRNEVSVMIGYPFKSGADAAVEVGSAKFAMNTQSDGAWIKNVAEEARLIEIMRKGSELTVTGTSSKGTQSVDRYSLKGLSTALDRTSQECK
jgi:invasion protein IalB